MISRGAKTVVSQFLGWGCNIFCVFPYVWDERRFRLRHAPKDHIFLYNCHRYIQWFMTSWCYGRFLQSLTWDHMTNRIRAIQGVWVFAYTLDSLCYVQFELKRNELLTFANALFAYIEDEKHENEYKTTGRDTVSIYMVLSGILLVGNPMAHAAMMFESPCTPHFVSALAFQCDRPDEDVETIWRKLPFFLFETYIVGVCLWVWFFSWALIYLGLAWIIKETKILKKNAREAAGELRASQYHAVYEKYRELQITILSLNEGCKTYLEWFPTILLTETAIMMYGTLRFYYLDIHSFLMFPACAVRCIIESMTLLSLAGHVNQGSYVLLEDWNHQKLRPPGPQNGEKVDRRNKWLSSFRDSCPYLKCTAGSLYTFENSIVLVTISNCIQLTVNLLLLMP